MGNVQIAIDGPAGAGKSTLSKKAAKELGFLYIDTGAMYRAAALFAINNGIDVKKESQKLISILDSMDIDMVYDKAGNKIFLNGRDVTKEIRQEKVGVAASDTAAIPEVREKLVAIQRELAAKNNVIMDGRDIGTHVLKNADLKVFLTAASSERAKRRYKELEEKGEKPNLAKIQADIEYRDKQDSERKVSPLKKAEDAVVFDTTDINFEEALDELKRMISECVDRRTLSHTDK